MTHYRTATIGGVSMIAMPSAARVAEFDAAFDLVKNRDHWKGPIDATLAGASPALVATVLDAIEFYTATDGVATKLGDGVYRITAPGYWAGPAN